MQLPTTPLGTAVAAGSILAGLASVVLTAYLWRHRRSPGAVWFVLSIAAQSLWCLTFGASLLVTDPAIRVLLEGVWWAGMVWTGPLFLLFTLEYTGRNTLLGRWTLAAVLGPALLTTGLALTTPGHDLVWSQFRLVETAGLPVAAYTIEPLGLLGVLVGTTGAGVGVLLLIETVVSYGPLYRREAVAVALSAAGPTVGLTLWLFRLGPVPFLNLAPALFLTHVALDGYAFVGSNMFETNPATRRAAERSVIDDIESPILVLDTNHDIVEVNDEAARRFDLDVRATLGTPVGDVIDVRVGPDVDQQTVTTRVGGRTREFVAQVSPLTDPAGSVVGYTVVMQDVTEQRQREQRLSVLSRVLRHNLRNGMNVILGRAELIEGASETPLVTESATVIRDRGKDLLDISEQAQEFERVMETESRFEPVAVETVVEQVASDLRAAFPDATVEVADGTDVTIDTDRATLALVLSSLGEYALDRNGAATPRLRFGVLADDPEADLVVTVDDNGPGLDESELAPVREGEETALEHASGIALWIVSWGTTILGGDASLHETEEGMTAEVRLPRDATDERE